MKSVRSVRSVRCLSPLETAVEDGCKQVLKSRLFRGYYDERRYVETIDSYRDVVTLTCDEYELAIQLVAIQELLEQFYRDRRPMWPAITHTRLSGAPVHKDALLTCIWTELNGVAFGEYWFIIKRVHLRRNEMVMRLRVARAVLPEDIDPVYAENGIVSYNKPALMANEFGKKVPSVPRIRRLDAGHYLRLWSRVLWRRAGRCVRHGLTFKNIIGAVGLVAWLIWSLLCYMVLGFRYLGMFTMYFLFEVRRLSYVLWPILLKGLEVLTNALLGLGKLLLMILKDVVRLLLSGQQF